MDREWIIRQDDRERAIEVVWNNVRKELPPGMDRSAVVRLLDAGFDQYQVRAIILAAVDIADALHAAKQ